MPVFTIFPLNWLTTVNAWRLDHTQLLLCSVDFYGSSLILRVSSKSRRDIYVFKVRDFFCPCDQFLQAFRTRLVFVGYVGNLSPFKVKNAFVKEKKNYTQTANNAWKMKNSKRVYLHVCILHKCVFYSMSCVWEFTQFGINSFLQFLQQI